MFHISRAALSSSVAGLLWRMKKGWPRETGACRRAESGKDTVVNSRNLRPQWAGREQRGRGPGASRVWGREREEELDSTYLPSVSTRFYLIPPSAAHETSTMWNQGTLPPKEKRLRLR